MNQERRNRHESAGWCWPLLCASSSGQAWRWPGGCKPIRKCLVAALWLAVAYSGGLAPARVIRMPQFDLSATIDGEWAVLALNGEVDLATAPAVRECLNELAGGGARHVVVDLRQVSFLDSIGLGVLVAAYRRLRASDPPGSLRLAAANERVVKVFALTGLLGIFPMHALVEQARAAADDHAPGPPGGQGGG